MWTFLEKLELTELQEIKGGKKKPLQGNLLIYGDP